MLAISSHPLKEKLKAEGQRMSWRWKVRGGGGWSKVCESKQETAFEKNNVPIRNYFLLLWSNCRHNCPFYKLLWQAGNQRIFFKGQFLGKNNWRNQSFKEPLRIASFSLLRRMRMARPWLLPWEWGGEQGALCFLVSSQSGEQVAVAYAHLDAKCYGKKKSNSCCKRRLCTLRAFTVLLLA